jgi:hypothetical protein
MNCNTLKKGVAWLMIIAMLNLVAGCRNYFKVVTAPDVSTGRIMELRDTGKTFVVHYNTRRWILEYFDIKNDTIRGLFTEYKSVGKEIAVNPRKPNRYFDRASNDQRYLLNEIHFYLTEYADLGSNRVAIPVNTIQRIDIYDKDKAMTTGSWIMGGLGVTASVLTVIAVIALATKESCPFIYTSDGDNFHFAGEIYSGSIHKPLERNDYLKLPTYPGQKSYKLKITNEVREIQHTNLMELQVFDHPRDMTLMVDKYGNINTFRNLKPPATAANLQGEDVTSLVTAKDAFYYQSPVSSDPAPLKDGIILSFPNGQHAKSAKLAIRAKNSIILDFTMRELNNLFGFAYHHFQKQQNRASREELTNLALTQGIPLSVYVERQGKWEFTDYFNVAGPMAFKEDVLTIPLTGEEQDPLRVKLEYGNLLWEIDYTAIDYTSNQEVHAYTAPVSTAVNEKQEDITGLIRQDDRKYYIQPETVNQAEITFNLPEMKDEARTIVLHSKGWYEVLQDPKGKPDLAYLKSFRKPGVFNTFTNEQVKKSWQFISDLQ